MIALLSTPYMKSLQIYIISQQKIECFHVTSQSSKFSRENSRRHVGVPSRLIKSLGFTVIYIIKDV